MRTKSFVILSAVALGAVGMAQAELAGLKRDADSEVRALQQQVTELQAKLKALEDRLAKVESARKPAEAPRIQVAPKAPAAPPGWVVPSLPDLLGKGRPRPQVWGSGEVNGWPYYLIPCDAR